MHGAINLQSAALEQQMVVHSAKPKQRYQQQQQQEQQNNTSNSSSHTHSSLTSSSSPYQSSPSSPSPLNNGIGGVRQKSAAGLPKSPTAAAASSSTEGAPRLPQSVDSNSSIASSTTNTNSYSNYYSLNNSTTMPPNTTNERSSAVDDSSNSAHHGGGPVVIPNGSQVSSAHTLAGSLLAAEKDDGLPMISPLQSLDVSVSAAASPAMVASVSEFYRDRCLLITGATGFMGKVLVEKLLRSCPAVRKIYLLMRPRGNKDVQTRLSDLLHSKLFDNVRSKNSEVLLKLVAIEGDIMEPGLGLSQANTELLAAEVSVVFHCAATVKFDEAIKLSLQMNVLGTKRMVELCQKMSKLVSLVHVSTAYCNCDRNEVDEVVYDPPNDPYKLLQLLDLMDDQHFDYLTPKLVGNRPNTYTFTKALAEHILVREAKGLPVCIVRPSIVAAAWREPIPGWVDNFNGPTGLIVGAGKGMLRTLHCHEELVADLIPVDIPINLLIVTACYTALQSSTSEEIKVFNCVSGMERPVRWREVREFGMHALKREAAMSDVVWYPSLHFTSSKVLNAVGSVVQHWIPAYVMDAIAKLAGKKPIMMKVAHKLDRAAACLEYFTTHEWHFKSSNVQNLWSKLPEHDKQMFNFDLSSLDWKAYMYHYCKGTKLHVMKEDDSTLKSSRSHINMLWWIHGIVRVLVTLLAWRVLMLRSTVARDSFYALLRAFLRFITYLPLVNRI